jgi:ATP-dependent helicase HepA
LPVDQQVLCPLCATPMELRQGRRGAFWGCPRFPGCRGSRDYNDPLASSGSRPRSPRKTTARSTGKDSIKLGDLLESKSNGLGAGKALKKGDAPGTILLEYFDSPGQPAEDRHTEEVQIPDLKRHHLMSESRVYWQRSDAETRWAAGRVMSIAPDGQVEVRSAGGRDHLFLDVADLYVRWNEPLRDPTAMASQGVFESPHNAETRYPVLESELEQRAATRGMPGLFGLAAELHAHQLTAARRVLEDRVQRYLLADEVGLGKTIEALLVVRQLLIEEPGSDVRIIVPPHLVGQWEDELKNKLQPGQYPMAEVFVRSHDDPRGWDAGDLLVIDEAHQLVADWQSADLQSELERICRASPRLLLLSATPALHNERAFLNMLHLLDPDVYKVDDVEGFRRRLESRQELGRALLGLSSGGPDFLLRGAIARLRAVLEGQDQLRELLETVESTTGEEQAAAIGVFRQQVADTFQVHRRMIRTRRTEGLSATFPLSGRRGCGVLSLPEEGWAEIIDGVDLVRERLAIDVEEGIRPEIEAAELLARVVSAFPDAAAMNELLSAASVDVAMDDQHLQELLEALADEASYLLKHGQNAVAFTPTPELAEALATALTDIVGPEAVRVVNARTDSATVRARVREHEHGAGVSWLVVDRSAEHGMNLQYADLLLHVGLPGLVTDLEQRIGRFDRWSAERRSWEALEVAPSAGLVATWSRIVREGFGVHDRSLAALQRAVEQQSLEVWARLLRSGAVVDDIISEVRSALDAEVEAVREQDAIDAVVLGRDDMAFADRVIDCDRAQDDQIGHAFDALMSSRPGNLSFDRERDPVGGAGRYRAPEPSQRRSRRALVPLWRMRNLMRVLEFPISSQRDIALKEQVSLLRSCHPLFTGIVDYLRHDDRGRAFGMWRFDPGHMGAPQVWLRVAAHLHADPTVVASAADVPEVHARRRLDAAFAPRLISRLWHPEKTSPTESERHRLDAPYQPAQDAAVEHGADFNLNRDRIPALHAVLDGGLEGFVEDGVSAITSTVVHDDEVEHAIRQARQHLQASHSASVAALQRRLAAGTHDHRDVEEELEINSRVLPLLLDAVESPQVTIDSIGVIVLSSQNPWAQAEL